MPKAFSPQERALINQRLLEQGYRFFSTYGLKKTSVEELARSVGISKAAFYLFFASKEALFMDVVEQAEVNYRKVVLASLDEPGPNPRVRLVALLERAMTHWKAEPVLQIFTGGEYNLLISRLPPEKVAEHLQSDAEFVHVLVERCRETGILIQAQPEEIGQLLYALFFTFLHADDLGPEGFSGGIRILLELVAAYCLGEITLQSVTPLISSVDPLKVLKNETVD
ncbi:MAG: TetR/AcrR family transcriptional regulator [Chloroflexi bacterium]|nr:TetR/AcrR family transcriptional regulator [Anaerolineaceae bacterium]NMB87020.1 TetR/AcrR family transcriptional regulator [Chloroflexota bacterium]